MTKKELNRLKQLLIDFLALELSNEPHSDRLKFDKTVIASAVAIIIRRIK